MTLQTNAGRAREPNVSGEDDLPQSANIGGAQDLKHAQSEIEGWLSLH